MTRNIALIWRRVAPACCTFAVLGLFASGCSRGVAWLDRKDRADPLVKRAQARVKEGDVKSAVRLYLAALDNDPSLARAHLDLALLYHDTEKDYVRAIYHYRRYQELRGSTEKMQMIEDRIRVAGQQFAATMQRPDAHTQDKAELEQENQSLKMNIDRLNSEMEALREKYQQLVAAVRQQRTSTVPGDSSPAVLPGREVVLPETGSGRRAAEFSPGPDRGGTSTAGTVKTYRVRHGDTLSSIAAECYNDRSQWPKILAANRRLLGDSATLKVGQLIVIP
jgi:hypothetical protein